MQTIPREASLHANRSNKKIVEYLWTTYLSKHTYLFQSGSTIPQKYLCTYYFLVTEEFHLRAKISDNTPVTLTVLYMRTEF